MRAARNVVGVNGGLGNQLFQVAFALWLEANTPYPSVLDLSAYRRRPEYLGLGELGLRGLRATHRADLLPHPTGRRSRTGVIGRLLLGPRRVVLATHPSQLVSEHASREPAWWYGYWQDPGQVDEVLPRLRRMLRGADAGAIHAIGLHVRRGDADAASVLGTGWYGRALARLLATHPDARELPVVVHSDDPAWCERHLGIEARFAPAGSAADDLRTLARYRFLVLSSSTFSWWAAHLHPRDPATVIAPTPFSGFRGQRLERDGWLLEPRS